MSLTQSKPYQERPEKISKSEPEVWYLRIYRRIRKPSDDLTDNEWLRRKHRRYQLTKIYPFILFAVAGYALYVHSYVLSYRYLIQSENGYRRSAGIALMVIACFSILLCLVYMISLHALGPGLVPKGWGKQIGPQLEVYTSRHESLNTVSNAEPVLEDSRPSEGTLTADLEQGMYQDLLHTILHPRSAVYSAAESLPEAFICEADGYPQWCSQCQAMKPDRAHHSNELGRCVLKMDHFCPWVGSIIGFANYKCFFLLIGTAGFYSLFIAVTTIIFTVIYSHERHHLVAQFVIVDVVSALFASVIIPFFSTHLFYICSNKTTIEYLNRKYRVYTLSIAGVVPEKPNVRAVATTGPGAPLWNVSVWHNWKSVMGTYPWDWVLPWTFCNASNGYTFEYNRKFLESMRSKIRAQALESRNSVNTQQPTFMVLHSTRL
ncbi:DHHC palmitoyltransferase-domain-containing protein [Lipomyces oligophaga]|uniref:DHHC palmitoyltransferase-domain-containing protein n=1 Tax=Lipomyces oligophaga TaxID=45792 RepID=UPI0034CF1776